VRLDVGDKVIELLLFDNGERFGEGMNLDVLFGHYCWPLSFLTPAHAETLMSALSDSAGCGNLARFYPPLPGGSRTCARQWSNDCELSTIKSAERPFWALADMAGATTDSSR
jgi:hypothetical protein